MRAPYESRWHVGLLALGGVVTTLYVLSMAPSHIIKFDLEGAAASLEKVRWCI